MLCAIYNETFNSLRPREYDGQHIRFAGMNPEITLRKHQVNAIAHIMYGGNTLLAHEVGAGKTFEIVAAAMESKRLGLCAKSLIVVPNHITEQWAAEWLQLYPSANILVATKRDFETKNRKKFCARIATGDYDAIIIGHSQFEKIPMSVERQQGILRRQIDSIMEEMGLAGCEFQNLIDIITTEENIRLAYRNLKKNAGSKTPGTDGKTIRDLAKLSETELIGIVQQKFKWYQPQSVRRKEIPKGNGKTRPLGIPTIMDRLIQQCVLQVMEPICEAKFCDTSNGFRPNRGVENALAQAEKYMQKSHMHIVIDIDIKGFFDNVHHGKLLKQMWAMGFRDKKLLCIISAMLKAEVAGFGFPEKGTPQGGIISPLLSNIVLNELDWWITSQWIEIPTRHEYSGRIHATGTKDQSKKFRELRKTRLKECYIVRYADDFKIFCRKHSDAVKLFAAVQAWLKERLNLDISPEKSKIVNLKHDYSDFLGFRIKVHKGKKNKYVVISHIAPKALEKIKEKAKEKVTKIQFCSGQLEEYQAVNDYNSFVMGIHNYYCMATCANPDMQTLAYEIKISIKNRLQERVKRRTEEPIPEYAKRYSKSKEIRFIGKTILLPIGYIQHHPPIHKKKAINKYTVEGRAEIHKNLESVDMTVLHILM